MIKPNKRVPGTINSTPIHKISSNTANSQSHQYKQPISIQDYDADTLPLSQHNSNYQLERVYKGGREEIIQKHWSQQVIQADYSCRQIQQLQRDMDADTKWYLISTLNLANNLINSFSANIFNKLTSLTKLYLNNNLLQKISFPYFKKNQLRIIDISENKLSTMNLQHIDTLIKLECHHNELSFLNLPSSIQILDCSYNKLSNLYFIEHAYLLEEVNMSHNLLYDLKFNFKPYVRFKDEDSYRKCKNYYHLHSVNCSYNKIQFIEGMDYLPNLKIFIINDNQISITRHILNQLSHLENLQIINFQNNPIQSTGFTEEEVINTILSKLRNLISINTLDISGLEGSMSERSCSTQRKSNFSGINEQPYQLFMDSHRKTTKAFPNLQWNFTLGDCQNQNKSAEKIHELSQIKAVRHYDFTNTQPQQKEALRKTDLQETYHFGGINANKQIKIKIVKSPTPIIPYHTFYQQYLNALLPMSFLPPHRISAGSDYTCGRRLEVEDDEYIMLDKMFENRGGVAYVKKIMRWSILEGNRQIFSRNNSEQGSMLGFLLNEMREQQFREKAKYNQLVRRSEKDIIGLQPNAFTNFHAIVRHYPSISQANYPSAYLVQTFQL